MKIIGIGNAIIDVICKVDDDFLLQNNLTKSTMKLVDETELIMAEWLARWFVDRGWCGVERRTIAHADYLT